MRRITLAVAVLALAATPLIAAVRLTYMNRPGVTPVPVYLPASAFPLKYTIDSRVADLIPGGQSSIDSAFNVWTTVPDAKVSFQSNGIASGLRATQDNKNTVTMCDGLFSGQGAIAMTTNWHDTDTGVLQEADIMIDQSIVSSGYSVQQAIEHEVGHFLGLDHSPVLTSVMYPYVGKDGMPSLDSDDKISIANLYPRVDPTTTGATLKGKVTGNDGAIYGAQVVAVNDSGEPIATSLSDANGEFVLQAVPPGNYRIYAEPLDGPVDPRNLAGAWHDTKMTSFPTRFATTGPIAVTSGNVYGNLSVNATGGPVQLNPKWIATSPTDATDFTLMSVPAVLRPGQTISLAVGGDGFTSGMTKFDVLNPAIQRISEFRYGSNFTYATFRVAPDARSGSAVVQVTSGNDIATLTGALRVEAGAAPPRVRLVRK